jgi:hypothetical protein
VELPFTSEQLFDLFAVYNSALWPAAVALWLASALTALTIFTAGVLMLAIPRSAAHADLVLPLAGIALAGASLRRTPAAAQPPTSI